MQKIYINKEKVNPQLEIISEKFDEATPYEKSEINSIIYGKLQKPFSDMQVLKFNREKAISQS
jgi:hypothetical protein